jgi:hypothetical protein
MVPFLATFSPEMFKRIALNCSFWGKLGHTGSVPLVVFDAWIRAALVATANSAEALVLAHDSATSDSPDLVHGSATDAPRRNGVTQPTAGPDPRDLQLASQLAQELLREGSRQDG